jgi:hypothetical protein
MSIATGRFDEDPIIRKLRQLGAHVQLDETGNIRHIRFAGRSISDRHVEQLGACRDVATIDVRDTSITVEGARRLQELLPTTVVQYRE